jgi:hypothetical protein
VCPPCDTECPAWAPTSPSEIARQEEDAGIEAAIAEAVSGVVHAVASEPLTGWTSSYYKIPDGATELQDLIEFKNMNFAIANIFKAAYRLGSKDGTTEVYDLEKIIWFAQRELERQK